jgi:hypothetical protein
LNRLFGNYGNQSGKNGGPHGKRQLKDRQKAERQIGRLQERNSRSASFTVTVLKQEQEKKTA